MQARPVLPGNVLRDELAVRGWTQKHLAEKMGRPAQVISAIINGHKRITVETALQLASALDTSVEFWWCLENQYQLHKAVKGE